MIIGNESPLRGLPSNLDSKQTLFLDAIRYCIEIADMSYIRLQETLLSMTDKYKIKETNFDIMTKSVSAFADAWLIIDSINRLQTLLNQMPNVKKKSPGFIQFSKKTVVVEELRHHFQHLNNEIDKLVASNSNAFGILTWIVMLDVPPTRCLSCLLHSGTMRSRVIPFINPLSMKLTYPISQITLNAGEKTLCLSDLMSELSKFTRSIEKELKSQTEGMPKAGSDFLIALEIEFGEKK